MCEFLCDKHPHENGTQKNFNEQTQPHAQHGVDVAANSPDVGSHEVGLGGLHAEILHHRLHGIHDPLLLFSDVQVWHIA